MSREVLSTFCSLHTLPLADKRAATMRTAIQKAGIGRFPPCDLELAGNHPELGTILQGDGFNVGGDLKFLQVHMHLLNDGRDALKVGHRFTVALADCAESRGAYKQMRVWDTVAKTQGKAWRHPITGAVYRLRYYLSGDWVFLKTILGVNNPNLDYFCLVLLQQVGDCRPRPQVAHRADWRAPGHGAAGGTPRPRRACARGC